MDLATLEHCSVPQTMRTTFASALAPTRTVRIALSVASPRSTISIKRAALVAFRSLSRTPAIAHPVEFARRAVAEQVMLGLPGDRVEFVLPIAGNPNSVRGAHAGISISMWIRSFHLERE